MYHKHQARFKHDVNLLYFIKKVCLVVLPNDRMTFSSTSSYLDRREVQEARALGEYSTGHSAYR